MTSSDLFTYDIFIYVFPWISPNSHPGSTRISWLQMAAGYPLPDALTAWNKASASLSATQRLWRWPPWAFALDVFLWSLDIWHGTAKVRASLRNASSGIASERALMHRFRTRLLLTTTTTTIIIIIIITIIIIVVLIIIIIRYKP